MNAPGVPADEADRLAELERYDILDTPPEQAFDDLVAIAAAVCDTPVAMVTLIDRDRQWIKAAFGMNPAECRREDSFCTYAMLMPHELLVVPDTFQDPRFRASPWVLEPPEVRFYAGAPLVTPAGHGLGALCVVDHRPRELASGQLRALEGLARQAVAQIELRRANAELRHHVAERAWYEQQMEMAQRQLAEENAQLAHTSLTDELTGLPNRRAAGIRLEQARERAAALGAPLSIAIVDIDFFKAINDRHGHPAGDEVLVRVGQALVSQAPEGAMVARLGGEEFLVLLPDHDLVAATAACEAMRDAVASIGGDHPVTISIGITGCAAGDDLSRNYARADQALYRAKQSGRNRVAVQT
ncbi:sensor domain-containing diguanylate cyclase [Luteimonas sp. MJ246]|uniref:sensor domain-containing diguanylate cyclase n=1 Tax=Luteimonas sp. MJ174 TaxID=3129237 RepID=UPI0031BB33C2